jgi:hypothetical protein
LDAAIRIGSDSSASWCRPRCGRARCRHRLSFVASGFEFFGPRTKAQRRVVLAHVGAVQKADFRIEVLVDAQSFELNALAVAAVFHLRPVAHVVAADAL